MSKAEEYHSPSAGDSSSGHLKSSIIPTPDCNSNARVQPKETIPHFNHEETNEDGITYTIYKAVGPFVAHVPSEEVIGLISMEESCSSWKLDPAGNKTSLCSDIFQNWSWPKISCTCGIEH